MEAVVKVHSQIIKVMMLLTGNLHFAAPLIYKLVEDLFVLLEKLIAHQYLLLPDGAVMQQCYFLVYIGKELTVILLPEINNAGFSLACVCVSVRTCAL